MTSYWPNVVSLPQLPNDSTDASAVLALVHDEPGADLVAGELGSATLGAANLAEVIGKLIDANIDVSRIRALLAAAGVTIEPFSRRTPNWPAPCVP